MATNFECKDGNCWYCNPKYPLQKETETEPKDSSEKTEQRLNSKQDKR